jgi:transposase-like protein
MDSSAQISSQIPANPAVGVLVLIAVLTGFLLWWLLRLGTRNREANPGLQTQTPPPEDVPPAMPPVVAQAQTIRHRSPARQIPEQRPTAPPPQPAETAPPAALTPAPPQIQIPVPRAPQETTAQPAAARIHTRTGNNPKGQALSDPYADQERKWSAAEKDQAIKLYQAGGTIISIARRMGIDHQQVAVCLIRELFNFEGEIDDRSSAPRNGKTYTKDELAKLKSYYEAGLPIADIAAALERTVLGAGRRMIDLQVP